MDKLTPQQRHVNMAAIRSKDTKPEMIVRRGLWSRGFRYRLLGAEEIQDLHLHQWMLLAWTQRDRVTDGRCNSEFGVLQDSKDKQGVLGGEDSQEQGTR